MPEAPEIRIMSDFINQNSKSNKFKKLFHVEKGNNAVDSNYDEYVVSADFYGKQLQLNFINSFANEYKLVTLPILFFSPKNDCMEI